MKIAVFGANGMAGHVIAKYLSTIYHEVICVARNGVPLCCDVENFHKVSSVLHLLDDCDYVINCIGLLVKDSITRPDRAAIINSWFPHYLEQWFKNKKARVVHLSTDCVFDGAKGYYIENDSHTEMNAYGRSKSLGEINNGKDITFRTSIIGPELKIGGTGLLHWVTTSKDSTLNGYNDHWWNGITTLQMAKCIEKYIENPGISGIYHLVDNRNSITKYELLNMINDVYDLGKTILNVTGPKPVNKILVDTRQEIDWGIQDYYTQLSELHNLNK